MDLVRFAPLKLFIIIKSIEPDEGNVNFGPEFECQLAFKSSPEFFFHVHLNFAVVAGYNFQANISLELLKRVDEIVARGSGEVPSWKHEFHCLQSISGGTSSLDDTRKYNSQISVS